MPTPTIAASGHEEKFRVEDSEIGLLRRASGPQRFRCKAYSGVDVSRAYGRMVICSAGIRRGDKMGMLLEHDDMVGVAVCDKHEVTEDGALYLEGYFLDDKASGGHASQLISKLEQGWPMKMSVGIRFRRHSFIEDSVEVQVNGRTLKGPMVVVDECDLFETSFIHVNPADLDTEAALMRREKQQMADAAEPKVETIGGLTLDQIRAQAEKDALQRLAAEQDYEATLRLAYPGKGEKSKAARLKARQDNLTVEQLRVLGVERMKSKINRLERREADTAEGLKAVTAASPHAAPGLEVAKAVVVQERPESGDFTSMKLEERVYAELRKRPALADALKGEAESTIKAWLKTKDRLASRDGVTPVLCDLLGGGKRVSPTTYESMERMAHDIDVGIKAARLDAGSSGQDLSKIIANGFQGQFYSSYEEELSKNWSLELSFQIPSDQQIEVVRWLSAPPMIQEWSGPRIAKDIKIYEQILKAVKFEGTLDIDRFDWDHQKFDLIAKSFGLMGAVASQHWDLRFTQLLENNPTAYDGASLFSGAHALGGESGTIKNDVTSSGTGSTDTASKLAVADPTMPTQLEWANIILQLTPKFRTWAWANGLKMNGHARQWGIMVHPDFEGNLQAAVSSERLDLGATNPLFGQRSQYKVMPNAFLTAKKYGYIFRLDTMNKPLLRAEPDPLEMQWQGPGSHRAFENDKYSMGLRCVRSIAPGAFESCMRFTIGAA